MGKSLKEIVTKDFPKVEKHPIRDYEKSCETCVKNKTIKACKAAIPDLNLGELENEVMEAMKKESNTGTEKNFHRRYAKMIVNKLAESAEKWLVGGKK